MDSFNRLEAKSLLRGWKKALFFAAYVLGGFYMLFAALCYVFPSEPFEDIVFYAGLGLAAISLLSLVFFVAAFPETRHRIGQFSRRMLSYEQVFVIVFFLWYIVVCMIRQRVEHLPYLWVLSREIVYTGISGLVLFPMARAVGKEKSFPVIEYLLHLVILVYSCFTAIALYHACHLKDLVLPSGSEAGLTKNMQLFLGTHYNMTGAIACIMIALCLYMIFSQKMWLKVLYAVLAAMHLLVVILSNSRTDFVGTLFLIAVTVFCYSWYCLSGKKRIPAWGKVLLCIGISGAAGVLLYLCRGPFIKGFDVLTGFSASLAQETLKSGRGTEWFFPAHISLRQGDYQATALAVTTREISEGLNGRTDIWHAACKVIVHDWMNYFLGVTPVGIINALVEIGGITEEFYGSHNAFLDAATEFGVPMGIAFILFAVRIVFRSFRILLRAKGEEFKKIFMIPVTVCTLLVLNLVEGYLLAFLCIQSCIFYLFCGWIVAIDKEELEHKEKKNRILAIANISCAAVICAGCVLALSLYSTRYINPTIEHFKGSGTEEDPYRIESRGDLNYFRDMVNLGNDMEGLYFLQTKDIDLKNKEWKPIGIDLSEKYFKGIYDGGCHTVKNINIIGRFTLGPRNVALFGFLQGTVKNLGIESGIISGGYIGSIASHGNGDALILNCYNKANIKGGGRAGGIIDHFSGGTVMCCVNEGKLSAPITADICSFTVGNLWATDDENNITENFAGNFHELKMEGETIEERLNAGLEELIEQGVIDRTDVRFW